MLHAVEVKPDVYWVGGVDWNERNFHGYTTDRGSTYNAYLIMDEQPTLIDTCKPAFADELVERVREVVDPARIEHIVANHVEQDHSGALPALCALAPNARIYASAPHGVSGLAAHYGDRGYVPVKTGDTLAIGKRTLTFTQTVMVHWPDNMVAYSDADRILFSNDAFGQHYASSKRFDDEVGLPEVLAQAKKYYANIVMPYSRHVQRALGALGGLDIDMIAPSHGVVWRSHVPRYWTPTRAGARSRPRTTPWWFTTPCGIPPRPWPARYWRRSSSAASPRACSTSRRTTSPTS
ncbi:MAG: FprA family A-type flavoprotein [Gordonibacter pamelaeae]